MPTIPIQTPTAAYPVHIGPNLLPQIPQFLPTLTPRTLRPFLITSPEIARLHAEPLLAAFATRPPVLLIPPGESHKRLPTLERLAEELAQLNADRDSLLLALGGGVLGDLTGFLAAVYMRGIPYLQLPTTALAMIDSSVGGKTGANLAAGKNLIGAFHHPLAVFADTTTLCTLPPAELRAGLQEAIKAAILRSPDLFAFLETNAPAILRGDPGPLTHVIAASVQIKADIVAADEREANLRMTLNLGHTPVQTQIPPTRILPHNQPDLLHPRPPLQLLLPPNRRIHQRKPLKIHQPVNAVTCRKPTRIHPIPVLPNPPLQPRGHTNIQVLETARQNINARKPLHSSRALCATA